MSLIKYKIKISKLDFDLNNLTIESSNGDQFMSQIKKGSVECKIFNESNQEVNLSNLELDSVITIFGSQLKNKITDKDKLYNYLVNGPDNPNDNTEKNIIVIKKIIVKNNYVFNSDSSDENNNYE